MSYAYITTIADVDSATLVDRIARCQAELARVEAGEETRDDMDAELSALFPLADHAVTLRSTIEIARQELNRRKS